MRPAGYLLLPMFHPVQFWQVDGPSGRGAGSSITNADLPVIQEVVVAKRRITLMLQTSPAARVIRRRCLRGGLSDCLAILKSDKRAMPSQRVCLFPVP